MSETTPSTKPEFWCASCHRHRPIALLAARRDKARSYCRDCHEKRQQALRAIRSGPAQPEES
jgi:hypothetical protein